MVHIFLFESHNFNFIGKFISIFLEYTVSIFTHDLNTTQILPEFLASDQHIDLLPEFLPLVAEHPAIAAHYPLNFLSAELQIQLDHTFLLLHLLRFLAIGHHGLMLFFAGSGIYSVRFKIWQLVQDHDAVF